MRKILYFSVTVALFFGGMACHKEENSPIRKPAGITFGQVEDKAGNVYRTLTIGNQTWMAENFRYALPNGSLDGCVTYGEAYGTDREVLTGSNDSKYQSFCRTHNGQRLLLYLREQLIVAGEQNLLTVDGKKWAEDISKQASSYSIPRLIEQTPKLEKIAVELNAIWNDALDNYFKVDKEYLKRFGYLYSYDGALEAVSKGAPEGFHLPTDAEWMMLERQLGMDPSELEGLEEWRGGSAGELLKAGEQGIGFDALYGGAAVYALSTAYNSRYVYKDQAAYFWSSDNVVVSDSLSNGIVRSISFNKPGIMRITSRLFSSQTAVRPSYSVRLVKTNE